MWRGVSQPHSLIKAPAAAKSAGSLRGPWAPSAPAPPAPAAASLCSEQTRVTQLPSPWLPAPKHSLNLSHCCLVPGELVWCHFPQRAPQTLCGRQRPRSCGSPASSLPRHRGCCPCPELRPHPIRRTQSCQPIVGPSCPRAAMLGLLVLGDSQGAVLSPSLEHTVTAHGLRCSCLCHPVHACLSCPAQCLCPDSQMQWARSLLSPHSRDGRLRRHK